MVTAANKVIAVLDSSKFNRRGFNQVLPIEKTAENPQHQRAYHQPQHPFFTRTERAHCLQFRLCPARQTG